MAFSFDTILGQEGALTRRIYRNPPLIEAICEFRFVADDPWDGSEPGRIFERFSDEFPRREPVANLDLDITGDIDQVSHRVTQHSHLRLWREDESALLQIGQNFLSIRSLKPYMGWPDFRDLIGRALKQYLDISSPKGFQRVGLRYVNRFSFTERKIDLEDYLDIYPYTGKQLPQDYARFLVGLHFIYDDERDALKLQLSDAKGEPDRPLALLLDLDYFLNRSSDLTFETIGSWLEEAHQRVEDVFEGCIKHPLRAMFEEAESQ